MTTPPDNPWLEAKKAARRARQIAWNRSNKRPDRGRAWEAVRQAKASGQLQQEPCQVSLPNCAGPEARTQFHHTHGYAPEHHLTGLWVCKPCHDRLHRQERQRERRRQAREEARKVAASPVVAAL